MTNKKCDFFLEGPATSMNTQRFSICFLLLLELAATEATYTNCYSWCRSLKKCTCAVSCYNNCISRCEQLPNVRYCDVLGSCCGLKNTALCCGPKKSNYTAIFRFYI